jgi:hypothetical protein
MNGKRMVNVISIIIIKSVTMMVEIVVLVHVIRIVNLIQTQIYHHVYLNVELLAMNVLIILKIVIVVV